MKIIVIGAGHAGELAVQMLCRENHDVVVVDKKGEAIDFLTNAYSASGVCGNATGKAILKQAGADTADVLVALTGSDEVNILSCANAKAMGTRYTICSVSDQEVYQDSDYIKEKYQIDLLLNPKLETADAIAKQLGMATDIKAEGFIERMGAFFHFKVEEGSVLDGMMIKDIGETLGKKTLVATVSRKNKLHIPNGAFTLQAGDELGIIAANEVIPSLAERLGHARKPIKKVLVIGCGDIGRYLVKRLLAEKKRVKIIDHSKEQCEQLRKEFPENVEVSYAERIDSEVLMEEGINSMDVCVLLTGEDETNLVLSMFAWSLAVGMVVAKIDTPSYINIFKKVSIDHTITPSVVTGELVKTYVRNLEYHNQNGNDIFTMFPVGKGQGEAIGFYAYENSKGIRTALKDSSFRLKKDVLIAAIIRDRQFLIPNGNSEILPGDRVLVIAEEKENLRTLDDIFMS